jgi:hypothetical protein
LRGNYSGSAAWNNVVWTLVRQLDRATLLLASQKEQQHWGLTTLLSTVNAFAPTATGTGRRQEVGRGLSFALHSRTRALPANGAYLHVARSRCSCVRLSLPPARGCSCRNMAAYLPPRGLLMPFGSACNIRRNRGLPVTSRCWPAAVRLLLRFRLSACVLPADCCGCRAARLHSGRISSCHVLLLLRLRYRCRDYTAMRVAAALHCCTRYACCRSCRHLVFLMTPLALHCCRCSGYLHAVHRVTLIARCSLRTALLPAAPVPYAYLLRYAVTFTAAAGRYAACTRRTLRWLY